MCQVFCNFGTPLFLFSVGLVSPTAFHFEAKSQLASSPPKVRSHYRANSKFFSPKNCLCKHRRYFFAKKLANLKNL